ncbi:MAG TPA: hypothetical protein VIL23_04810, partial [Clostridia bacterium]
FWLIVFGGSFQKANNLNCFIRSIILSILVIPLAIASGIGIVCLFLNSIAKAIAKASYIDFIFKLDVILFI